MSFDFSRSGSDERVSLRANDELYAKEAALRSAHAFVVTKKNASELDAQVQSLTHGFLRMKPHESSELVGARLANLQGVKALLLHACTNYRTMEEASSNFTEMLIQRVKKDLPSDYTEDLKRHEKASSIVKKVLLDLEASGAFEEAWSITQARKDALTPSVKSSADSRRVQDMLVKLVEPQTGSQDDLLPLVFARHSTAIEKINLDRCQEHRQLFDDVLNPKQTTSLISRILTQINHRSDKSSSKTAEKIAAELVEEAASKSTPSVKALRHPMAQLWSNLSIASGKVVSLAEVRFHFAEILAIELRDKKGYSEADAFRKAQHIVNELCEGLNESSTKLYTQAYLDSLHITPGSFKSESASPTESILSETLAQHFRADFEAHRNGLGVADLSITPKYQADIGKKDVSTKQVAADILAQPNEVIQLWERALFAQEASPNLSATRKGVEDQLKAIFSNHLLAFFTSQHEAYQTAGMFQRIGKSEHAKDPATRVEEWVKELTDQLCKKIGSSGYSMDLRL